MKKLLLIAAFLGISTVSAFAACTSPAVMHDFPGTSFNMSLGTTPDGNCGSNVLVTTWGGVTLGAPSNYGTSPGAVAVPGVNAFITNTVPVTGTFWQTTQPVSGTFWQTTQPISAASLPLAPLAATSTKQSDGTQKSQQVDGSGNVAPAGDTAARAGFQKLTDGTNTAAVKAASTGAVATDPSAVTNESPNSQLSIDMHTTAVNSAAALPAQSNSTTNIGAVSGIVNVTPTDCSGTVTTGGTAQSAISASATIHGFTIANVDASTGSGEPIWISFTGTASAANGSYPLAPPAATTFASNGSYTTPMGFGANHAVSIFAATTGHKFSCTTW